jgi:hypothetical protein
MKPAREDHRARGASTAFATAPRRRESRRRRSRHTRGRGDSSRKEPRHQRHFEWREEVREPDIPRSLASAPGAAAGRADEPSQVAARRTHTIRLGSSTTRQKLLYFRCLDPAGRCPNSPALEQALQSLDLAASMHAMDNPRVGTRSSGRQKRPLQRLCLLVGRAGRAGAAPSAEWLPRLVSWAFQDHRDGEPKSRPRILNARQTPHPEPSIDVGLASADINRWRQGSSSIPNHRKPEKISR